MNWKEKPLKKDNLRFQAKGKLMKVLYSSNRKQKLLFNQPKENRRL